VTVCSSSGSRTGTNSTARRWCGAAARVGSRWPASAGDEGTGVSIGRCALEEPIRPVAENAGLEGSVVVEKVRTMVPVMLGFDAETNEYVDMIQAEIIDPTKVERVALENAAALVSRVVAAHDRSAHHGSPPPARARRRLGVFERAERAGGHDRSGWILYQIVKVFRAGLQKLKAVRRTSRHRFWPG
jgi:TCP-1/cpn60 chaperonin family